MENQLVTIVNESGLEQTKAQAILENFSNYFELAADWERKASALVVTSIEQKAEMKMAREGRLFLKEKRIAIEKKRKELKEQSLREGKIIDSISNILKGLIEPIENDLEQKEKFAETHEAIRRAALKHDREVELFPFMDFVPAGIDFGVMDEENYQKIFSGAKIQFEARRIAEERAEAERIENERIEELRWERADAIRPYYQFFNDTGINLGKMSSDEFSSLLSELKQKKADYEAEEKRIREENERLQREKEEAEKVAAAERAKAEAERKSIEEKARKEREEIERKAAEERRKAEEARKAAEEKARIEREKIARELAEERAKAEAERKRVADELEAKRKAEEKAKKEAEAAARKAANAPDKEKLLAFVNSIRSVAIPEVKSSDAKKISKYIARSISTLCASITTMASDL